jgi:hypothetical protein
MKEVDPPEQVSRIGAHECVMPVLDTGIHANTGAKKEDVDGRDAPGHDGTNGIRIPRIS